MCIVTHYGILLQMFKLLRLEPDRQCIFVYTTAGSASLLVVVMFFSVIRDGSGQDRRKGSDDQQAENF